MSLSSTQCVLHQLEMENELTYSIHWLYVKLELTLTSAIFDLVDIICLKYVSSYAESSLLAIST